MHGVGVVVVLLLLVELADIRFSAALDGLCSHIVMSWRQRRGLTLPQAQRYHRGRFFVSLHLSGLPTCLATTHDQPAPPTTGQVDALPCRLSASRGAAAAQRNLLACLRAGGDTDCDGAPSEPRPTRLSWLRTGPRFTDPARQRRAGSVSLCLSLACLAAYAPYPA